MPKPKCDSLTALYCLLFTLLGLVISMLYIHRWSYEHMEEAPRGFVILEQEQGYLLKRLPDMAEQFIGGDWNYVGSENGNMILYQNQEEQLQIHHIAAESIDTMNYPARDYPAERVAFSKENEWFFIEWPTDKGYLYCILSGWDIKSQDCNSFEIQGEGRLYWSALDSSTYIKVLADGSQVSYQLGQTGNTKDVQPLLKLGLEDAPLYMKLIWGDRGSLQKTSIFGQYYLDGKEGGGLLDTKHKKIVIF